LGDVVVLHQKKKKFGWIGKIKALFDKRQVILLYKNKNIFWIKYYNKKMIKKAGDG
jgi:hypothetical protein